MGLIINVYRSAAMPDCTLNGISSKHNTLTLVNAEGPFEPNGERPPVLMVRHPSLKGCAYIVPAYSHHEAGKEPVWKPIPGWWMMGGNYAATSDSRFYDLAEQLTGYRWHGAIKIHDRNEG